MVRADCEGADQFAGGLLHQITVVLLNHTPPRGSRRLGPTRRGLGGRTWDRKRQGLEEGEDAGLEKEDIGKARVKDRDWAG